MPSLFHQPQDRRSFLRISTLGAAALVAGCRTARRSTAGGPTTFRLALLSDTHVPGDRLNGHRGFNPWENLRRIVPDVVAARPEGVIVCGDAARLEGKPEDYVELRQLLEPVAAVAPVYIALGNHDHRENFLKAFPARAGVSAGVSGRHVLVVEHPVARLVLLDSLLAPNVTPGQLGNAQRKWLTGFLGEHRDRPVVLFVHHTLGDGDGELVDVDRLFEILHPHRQVKAVFYGHSHVWQLGRRDRVQLINLPAVGYNFNDKDPVGWVEARFDAAGVALTLRAFAGNRAEDGREVEVKWL